MSEIETLVENYFKWTREKTHVRNLENSKWAEITTPFLNRHNDCLQIYVKKEGDEIELTDDGTIVADLQSSGFDVKSDRNADIIRFHAVSFGVKIECGRLTARCGVQDFPLAKSNLLQAMLAIDDLFYFSRGLQTEYFFDDVVEWLEKLDVPFTPKVKFVGKSGFDNAFDFVIPKSKSNPHERIVQAISNPTKSAVQNLLFKWQDTRETRFAGSRLYAVVNDSNDALSPAERNALASYDIVSVRWSEKSATESFFV